MYSTRPIIVSVVMLYRLQSVALVDTAAIDPIDLKSLQSSLLECQPPNKEFLPPHLSGGAEGDYPAPEAVQKLAQRLLTIRNGPAENQVAYAADFRRLAEDLGIEDKGLLNRALNECSRRPKDSPGKPGFARTGPNEVERRYLHAKESESRIRIGESEQSVGAMLKEPLWETRRVEITPDSSLAQDKASNQGGFLRKAVYRSPDGYVTNEKKFGSFVSGEEPPLGYRPISENEKVWTTALRNPAQVEALHDTESGWNKLCQDTKDCFACKAPDITRSCFTDLDNKDLGKLRANLLDEYRRDCMPNGGSFRHVCNTWKHLKLFTKHGYFPNPLDGLCAVDVLAGQTHCTQ